MSETTKRIEEIRRNHCSCEHKRQCYTCNIVEELVPVIHQEVIRGKIEELEYIDNGYYDGLIYKMWDKQERIADLQQQIKE